MTAISCVNNQIIHHQSKGKIGVKTHDFTKDHNTFVKNSRKRKPDDDLSKPKSNAKKFSTASVAFLYEWLAEHIHKPYPDREEMESLAVGSGLTTDQVNNWFTNIRKRKLKVIGTERRIPLAFQYTHTAEGYNNDQFQIASRNRFFSVASETFALVTPCTSKLTKSSMQLRCIPLVTPNIVTRIFHEHEPEIVKVVAKYQTFHFSANDPIDIDMSDEDIDSLFEYSKERWNNCLRSFLATEVRIVEENGARPIHTASRSTNHHDRGIYSTAAKKYMHHCSAYINQGHAKDQHACAAVNISKKKHFGVNSTDQQFLDGFKLNLGILDDLEGGADDFGIMAAFHSQNM